MLETGRAGKWLVCYSSLNLLSGLMCARRWLKSEYTEPQKYQANLVSSLCTSLARLRVTVRADDCCVTCRSCCVLWDSLLGLCW